MATTLAFDLVAHDRASDKFDRLGRSVSSAGDKFGKLKTAAKAGGVAIAAAGIAAGKLAFDAVQAAGDLSETISKTNVVFGKGAELVTDFAGGAAQSLGQSKQAALDAASTFGVFGKMAGKSGDDLAGFSISLTRLASDMASFHNTSPEEAVEAIGAALRGEAEPIRKYGVLLDDATLRQEALKLGLIKTTKEALTPQQKVMAAQQAIFKQTSDAQGDFERTSGGLANQQRILKAELSNVQAEIGTKLLPVALRFATFLNSEGIPALQRFSGWAEDHVLPVVQKLGEWVQTKLVPALQKLASEIMSGANAAMEVLSGSGMDIKKVMGLIGDTITKVVIPAAGWLAKNVLPVLAAQFRISVEIISKMIDLAKGAWKAFKTGFAPILKIIQPIIDKIQALIDKMREAKGEELIGRGVIHGSAPIGGVDTGDGRGQVGTGAGTTAPPNSHPRSRGGDDVEERTYRGMRRALSEQPVVRVENSGRVAYEMGGY